MGIVSAVALAASGVWGLSPLVERPPEAGVLRRNTPTRKKSPPKGATSSVGLAGHLSYVNVETSLYSNNAAAAS